MGYELDKLKRQYGVGTANIAPYVGETLGAPPAETATPEQKAAFQEQLRKYQIDQRAYKAYTDEYANRLASTNMYAQPQYDTNQTRFRPAGQATVMGQPDTSTATRAVLNAPTYGAIPANVSAATDQGAMYKQMRDLGYTDADIRAATSKITGTPSDQMMANIYKAAYPQYTQAIESQYGSQFNRSGYGTGAGQIDYPGFNYYINQLSSGAVTPATLESAIRGGAAAPSTTPTTVPVTTPVTTPDIIAQPDYNPYNDWMQDQQARDAASAGGGGGAAKGGYISKYASGGAVRTHYQTGGQTQTGDNLSELENFYIQELANNPRRPIGSRLFSPPMEMPVQGPINVTGMSNNVGEGGTPQPNRREDNLAGLEEYYRQLSASPNAQSVAGATPPAGGAQPRGRRPSLYETELRDARARAAAESEAFSNMMQGMINSPESQQASRAEMYFRLAAAFGAPTRTGKMGETLSNVGQQLSEYSRGQRASEADRRKLMLEAQKIKMEGSRADLNTLRSLAQEELRDERALQTALIQAGRPQSRYGQAAVDMGLTPGTPEFNQYVRERAQQDAENAEEVTRLRVQAGDLAQRLAARRESQLSPREVNLRVETEDSIAGARQSLADIQEAYRLNENSFAGGLLDRGRRALLEAAGSDAPIVVNTRRLENLLGQQGLEKLKSTFGGSPTEGERKILLDLEGIGSKSLEERKQIIQRAYGVLRERIARQERRLADILAGRYSERSETTPSGGQ